ncbi:carbohydrate porin [Mucilaginibacter boryungensis]|uniref:Carbohydrate porin n=1 Tax=Mucilaginibacter boryungensis TaxID=768480 RepID=A0ABR9XNY6_9SPHI|nr:carbohydrate porin [Mucilaginibacter boryungensis]MBE9668758.1 carbohydrate porin [Mucilaginibacter boryungensis]
MKRLILFTIAIITTCFTASAQDTLKQQRFNLHFQQTIITQNKPAFSAKYTGDNSLQTGEETQTSLTTTLYGGARLWKGAQVYFNPEMSGGAGLSKTLGVAGFPNGETFRVGGDAPKIYIARLFYTQNFEWGNDKDTLTDEANQLAGTLSKRHFSFTIGKFGMADYFDNNSYSHDPRTQFMNWSLMSNGAWDYPANTRGYVMGLYTKFAQPTWTLRFAYTMVTTEANGAIWDERIGKANSQTLEFEKRYNMNGLPGAFRLLAFNNNGKMGSYRDALNRKPVNPEVDTLLTYGHRKFGFGLNAEQSLINDLGVFAKLSYNDGKTQTWFFTEIDRSFSFGGVLKGKSWKRADDELGLAFVANGLSKDHRDYLAAGGYGFIIGDGKLNYSTEMVAEAYYKINALEKKIWLSPGYQFIINPAYNKDRGPVNVFSLRVHVEF